jgi:hypothetical protein
VRRLLALAFLIGVFPASSVADPTPFTSVSVGCDPEFPSNYSTAAQATAHPHVIGRLTIPDGPGMWSPAGAPYLRFAGGDTMWEDHGSIAAGGTASGVVLCPHLLTYEVAFFDVPVTPATFTGVTSPGSDPSQLIFRAPAVAQYAADLVLQQGAVVLATDTGSEAFAATGRFELGTLDAGESALAVSAQPGVQAYWTIALKALPVTVSGLTFDVFAARPGVPMTARYVLSGQTAVTARIQKVKGALVRTLAESAPLGAGPHSLVWDGLDAVGGPARDGLYELRLDTADPSGWNRSAATFVTVDGTDPSLSLLGRRRGPRSRAVRVRASDRLSGVRSGLLKVDGRVVRRFSKDAFLVYRPRHGWRPGRHTLRLSATDRAGNSNALARRFLMR